jgi:hypothetical protein
MILTIQDLGALGELLGSVAVLVTLIYLALQMRQNTMAIAAQLDAARIGAVMTVNSLPITSPELAEALAADLVEPEPLDELLLAYWDTSIGQMQWQFSHARRGLVPSWNETGASFLVSRNFHRFRSYGEYWERRKEFLQPDFVEWVEEQRAKAA